MSKKLLQEYFELCPDDNCVLDILTEQEKSMRGQGTVFLVGVCQRAGVRNGNGRIYPQKVLSREVENYQKLVGQRRALGELDHPDDSVINLKNASHLCTKMWWDGDNVLGKFQVLDTPSGKVLQNLISANVKLGISSRGLGSVKEEKGNMVVEDDFQLICFDMVSEPSTPDAFVYPGGLNENRRRETMTKEDKINQALNDILGW